MKQNNDINTTILRENYRIYLMINSVTFVGLIAHALFIPLFFWLDVKLLALLNFASVATWLIAYYLNRRGIHGKATLLLVVEVIVHANFAVILLGWDSGFYYYLLTIPLYLFLNHNQKTQIVILETLLIFIIFIYLYIYTHQTDYQQALQPTVSNALHFMNVATTFVAFSLMGYIFRIASIRSERTMEQLATIDTVTNLINRRKMRELLERECIRYERSNKPFVIALGDIDHFKTINDTYGHDVGDAVLRQVSDNMQQALRKSDSLARWGGEEFLILLPETNLADGMQVIEKVRKMIAQTPCQVDGMNISMTITFGVNAYDNSETLSENIKQADQALYAGKNEGRNKVVQYQ